ncbi:hypothetical protein JCM3775_006953 [Rhodotorula graminis]
MATTQGTLYAPLSPRSSSKRPSPPRDLDSASQNKRVALTSPAPPPAPPAPPQDAADKHRAASGGPAPGGGGAGCRLLWRGTLTTLDRAPLHGVALIAHLFAVPSSLHSPLPPASSLSPFDDPFSSASSNTASGADMCLGLEMLRGSPIAIKGHVRVRKVGDSPDKAAASSSLAAGGAAPKKGKARARDEDELELVDVEMPTDVRVYVDARCPATVEWFEDSFCREGRAGYGVTLDAGGEEVILFAALPSLSDEQENLDPSFSSTSTPPSRPTLTLLLGRRARATVRKPRPDDPLPRESLFANKLRKTASLPASAFSMPSSTDLAPPPAKKPKRQTAKDKVIASLLGKNDEMAPPRSRPRANSSQPPSIAFPPPPPLPSAASRPFARSASSRFPSTASTSSYASLSRQASLPPLAAANVGRRASTSGPTGRPFQRTLSRSSMLLDSPPGSDDDFPPSAPHAQRPSRSASRAPSPTPSLSSVLGDADEQDDDAGGEGLDAVADLRSFGAPPSAARGGRGKGMARSSSLPVGQFALGGGGASASAGLGEKSGAARRAQREGTALPSAGTREGSAVPDGAKEGAIETRNKNTVKKLTLARMTALGCGKAHAEFRDVFSFTTRGVGFAMRSTFKTAVLSPAERELASSVIDQHLRLYLPSPSFPTPSPTPDLASTVVKQEPTPVALALPRMPSPHSLGDGLDEAVLAAATASQPLAAVEHGVDVDMDETQPHEEDAEPTQLHEEERSTAKAAVGALRGGEDEDLEDERDEFVLVTMAAGLQVKKEEPVA